MTRDPQKSVCVQQGWGVDRVSPAVQMVFTETMLLNWFVDNQSHKDL